MRSTDPGRATDTGRYTDTGSPVQLTREQKAELLRAKSDLNSGNTDQKEEAAGVIWDLALEKRNRHLLREEGVIPPLVALLEDKVRA